MSGPARTSAFMQQTKEKLMHISVYLSENDVIKAKMHVFGNKIFVVAFLNANEMYKRHTTNCIWIVVYFFVIFD